MNLAITALHRARVAAVVAFMCLGPGLLHAQTATAWSVVTDLGLYQIHDGTSWNPDGLLVGIALSRQWNAGRVYLRLGQGLAEDNSNDGITTLEPGVELALPHESTVRLVVGGGAGLMWEWSGTLSLPYYGQAGVEWQLGSSVRSRALLRLGAHANTGDAGTFRGPHAIMFGLAWAI